MTEHERLIVAGREIAISNPRKVLFPRAGLHQARPGALLPRRRRRRAARRRRPAERPRPLSERHRRRVLLPEARARVAAALDRGRLAAVSVRADGRGGRAARRRRAGLDGQPRLPRAAPASGAGRRSRSSRRAARRSRSGAGRRVGADPRRSRASSRRRSTTSASSAGRRRPARAACTSTCASSGAGPSTRCAAPRSRSRAKSSGARRSSRRASGGRRSATACSSTTTRTRRTGRSPAPTRCGRRRTRACRRRSRGTRSTRASRATSRWPRCRRASPHVGDRHAGIDEHRCSLERLLELSARQEREGQGDAPWPPHYRSRPASRRACSRRGAAMPSRPLIEIGRAAQQGDALAGLERWKARHPEAAAHLAPADVLVDAMRGRFRTWTRIRVNLQHVPVELRPAQEALDPDDAPNEWEGVSADGAPRRRPSRARKAP